jgi:hypothetical protein
MGSGGKGGGSSYTPPRVPELPVYQPPKPLPPLPVDPAKELNDKQYEERIASLKSDRDASVAKANRSKNAPLLYTREESKSIGPLE